MIDVGTGLSVFVRRPDFALLYDAGSNDDLAAGANNRVLAYLKAVAPDLHQIDHVMRKRHLWWRNEGATPRANRFGSSLDIYMRRIIPFNRLKSLRRLSKTYVVVFASFAGLRLRRLWPILFLRKHHGPCTVVS